MVKFGLKCYNIPTPKVLKVFADALLAATATISTTVLGQALTVINDPKQATACIWIALVSVIMGAIAKFISKFFGDLELLTTNENKYNYENKQI
jgi:hypothetical protein